jgi:hypothetical protein
MGYFFAVAVGEEVGRSQRESQAEPKSIVGVSLLAMAVDQSA